MSLVSRAGRLVVLVMLSAGLLSSNAPALASDTTNTTPVALTPLPTTLPISAVPIAIPPAIPTDPTTPAPRATFVSLADAVAAQDGLIEDEHIRCLASTIYFESQGQPLAGQHAVAQVILNRIKSGRFASDICGVVKQRGQFGFVRAGAIPSVPITRPAFRTAVAVAKVAVAQAWEAPAMDALYFNGVHAGHSGSKRVAVIGGHAFYR